MTTTTYKVIASQGVINEMVRYEDATIVSMRCVNQDRVDELIKRWKVPPDEQEDIIKQFSKYEAVIETDYLCVGRWRSFMIRPEVLS